MYYMAKIKKIEYMKELSEEIVQELFSSKKVRPWQLIDLAKFLELYEPYKEKTSKSHFGNILEVEYYNLKNGEKARVLKSRIDEFLKEEIKGIEKLKETNPNGACIKLLARYNELELPKKQAIEKTEKILEMSTEEILKAMQDYQVEQKKIEKTQEEGIAI